MGRLPWLLGWLLLCAPLGALAASVLIGRTVAPEVEEKDWTSNSVLKTKLRDALSLCISSAPASALAEKPTADKSSAKRTANGAARLQRAAGARGVSATPGEASVAAAAQSDALSLEGETAAALGLGDTETDNRTPCIPTEITSDEELSTRRKNARRRSGSSTSGYGSSGKRYANAFDGSSSRSPRRHNNEDDPHAETISEKDSIRNASRLGSVINGSPGSGKHGPKSASYQYEVPDYGGSWGSGSRVGDQWGGGGGGYGEVDFRYGGGSHSPGGGGYSGGDSGYRGGYGGGNFRDDYGASSGGFGSNGRRGGYHRSGSGGYGDNRNYGFGDGSDFDSGLNNGNSRSKSGGRRDGGGSRNGDRWGESDGETFHKVGSGGFSGNRKDNRNGGRGNSRTRDTRFQDDSKETDDSEGEDSDEDDDDEEDGYRGRGNGRSGRRGGRGEDDRRSRGSSRHRNSRGKRAWSGKGRLLAAVDPDNAFGEGEESKGGGGGRGGGARGKGGDWSRSRRPRSAPVKLRSRDGGYPCAVQCALTHMGVVDDLGFPCEETTRRVLRKMLGDGDGAVAAAAVSRCMLRVSGAVDEDSCDAADRLVECLRVDVDALLREMTAPEVEATTLPPGLIALSSASTSTSISTSTTTSASG